MLSSSEKSWYDERRMDGPSRSRLLLEDQVVLNDLSVVGLLGGVEATGWKRKRGLRGVMGGVGSAVVDVGLTGEQGRE